MVTPCSSSTLQTDYLKNRESSFRQLPGFLVPDILYPSSLEHVKRKKGHTSISIPSFRPCLSRGAVCVSQHCQAAPQHQVPATGLSQINLGLTSLSCRTWPWLPRRAGFHSLRLHTYVSLALLYQWNGFPGEGSSRPAIIMAPSGGWGERQAGARLRGECFGPKNHCTKSVEGWSNTSSHAQVCHGGCWYASATLLHPLTWEFSSRGGVLGTCETY